MSSVLVENHAVTLNPLDYKMAGYNFAQVELPACTGYDLSGRVVGVGKGVTAFKVGDEVFGCVNINTSNGGGALQQYTVADTDGLVKKPANLSHADAATLGVAYLSAMVSQSFLWQKSSVGSILASPMIRVKAPCPTVSRTVSVK
jgi:NADPH:quinone reductase-like Zn-dependent oxidoreductase